MQKYVPKAYFSIDPLLKAKYLVQELVSLFCGGFDLIPWKCVHCISRLYEPVLFSFGHLSAQSTSSSGSEKVGDEVPCLKKTLKLCDDCHYVVTCRAEYPQKTATSCRSFQRGRCGTVSAFVFSSLPWVHIHLLLSYLPHNTLHIFHL